MKKHILLASVSLFVFGIAGNVAAIPINFKDVVTPVLYFHNSGTDGYQHNLIDDGFNPGTDILSSATLDVYFLGFEKGKSSFTISLDGNAAGEIDDINHHPLFWNFNFLFGEYSSDVDVEYLQSDGILNILMTQTSGSGSELFLRSTATTYADRAIPTPEPASIILFGIGLCCLAVFGRKYTG